MKNALITAAAMSLTIQQALASDTGLWGGSYYCVEEEAGGLAYDTGRKHWIGTSFNSTDRFVLTMSYLHPAAPDPTLGEVYKATLTPAGTSTPNECIGYSYPKDTLVMLGLLNCGAIAGDFTFNFDSHRYLKTYSHGYVSGTDNNDDTPFVAGGTCTKIN